MVHRLNVTQGHNLSENYWVHIDIYCIYVMQYNKHCLNYSNINKYVSIKEAIKKCSATAQIKMYNHSYGEAFYKESFTKGVSSVS